MIVFRSTQRLAKRMGVQLADDALPSSGALGDWYANVLNVGTARYVLCLSERTLLPVILPARKAEFPLRFGDYLSVVLRHIDVPLDIVERETAGTSAPVFAKTKNRSLIGSLNDFVYCAGVHLQEGASPLETNLQLTEMPSGGLDFVFPSKAARAVLLAGPTP